MPESSSDLAVFQSWPNPAHVGSKQTPADSSERQSLEDCRKILVQPTPETQDIYDRLRNKLGIDELESHLSSSCGSDTSSPLVVMKALHGKHGNGLQPSGIRFKFHVNLLRKLKLACKSHKERQVMCICHDYSLL
ncbi:hypothetical protein MN608_09945 [Microdochium nivale]|nr:hypothetical protein MN608_09945 [Microdochium nivale]